ncbi:MAG: LamG-like jellyroll fold domain-containing protein [Armatimonadota bacterium]
MCTLRHRVVLALTIAVSLVCLPASAQQAPEPVAAFSFEGAADGVVAADIGDATGTLDPAKVRIVPGVSGEAIAFEGQEDQAAEIRGERLQSITDDLAISAWVRMDEKGGTQTPISRGWNWRLRLAPDIFEVTVGGDPWRQTYKRIYSEYIDTGRWYHVFYQYSTSEREFALYVNGERVDEETIGEDAAPLRDEGGAPLLLGADPGNYNLFRGSLDELAVYHTILSDDAIREVYMEHAPAVAAEDWVAMLAEYERDVREHGGEDLAGDFAELEATVRGVLDGEASWEQFHATQQRLNAFARHINDAVISRAAAEAGTPRMACFAVDPFSGEPILPDSPLPVEALSQQLTLRGAPGEWLTASFVLRPLEGDVNALTFDVTPPAGDGDAEIAPGGIDLRAVKCWYQGTSAWSSLRLGGERTPVLVPELLLRDPELVRVDEQAEHNFLKLRGEDGPEYLCISEEEVTHYPGEIEAGNQARIDVPAAEMPVADDAETLQPITIGQGRNQQMWLTIHVPEDAQPGDYAGTITWADADGAVGEIGIDLQVLPIELPKPASYHDPDMPFLFSVYYRAKLSGEGEPWIGSEYKSREQLRVELTDQVEHGMDYVQNRIHLDREEEMDTFQSILTEAGIERSGFYYNGVSNNLGANLRTDPETIEMMKERARRLMSLAESYGYEKAYTYAIDELPADEVREEKALWAILREMGLGVFVAGKHDVAEVAGEVLDVLVAPGSLSTETAAIMHSHGHRIFSYGNPQSGPENPHVFRLNYGVRLWKHNYDGAMTFAYQAAFGNVWNDFDGHVKNYRDHQFTYPTTSGIVGTMAWEGYRQAKQDIMYASLLQRLIHDHLGGDDARRAALAREAEEWLEGLMPDAETDLDAMRDRMIEYIVRLRG